MKAEIISVGTEILMGQILNTDAQYLCQLMNRFGITVHHESSIGDNMERMLEAIGLGASRCDLLILSGGLGPTADDITKNAVAQFIGVPMYRDAATADKITAYYARTNRVAPPNSYQMADFPEGCILLDNPVGQAPGCVVSHNDCTIVVLPGPPHELKAMCEKSLTPFLEKHMDRKIESRMVRVFGMGESNVQYVLSDIIEAQTNPTIAPYCSPCEVTLRVTASCPLDGDAQALLEPTVQQICERLGDCVYSTHGDDLAVVVAKLLKEQNKTLAIAESLTGGMVASELVNIPGISENLLEGIVAYSEGAKLRMGVAPEVLEKSGVVSEQTAIAMAEAVRRHAGADLGVSTTGVAGPGPDKDGNPSGLAFIGIADEKGSRAIQVKIGGGRNRVRTSVTLHALNAVRTMLGGTVD